MVRHGAGVTYYAESMGPPLASGWNWQPKIGREACTMPSLLEAGPWEGSRYLFHHHRRPLSPRSPSVRPAPSRHPDGTFAEYVGSASCGWAATAPVLPSMRRVHTVRKTSRVSEGRFISYHAVTDCALKPCATLSRLLPMSRQALPPAAVGCQYPVNLLNMS